MRTRLMGLALAALAASGCKAKDSGTAAGAAGGPTAAKKLTADDEQALRDVTKGLAAVANADPTERVSRLAELLAEVAGPAYAGFGDYVHASPAERARVLAQKTDLLCKQPGVDDALASAADPLQALVKVCGAAYYGLAPGQEGMMSVDWFLVQRAGAWLARLQAKAAGNEALLAPLDEALLGVRLPLPVPRVIALPHATQLAAVRSARYLVVTADAVTAAAMPVAVLIAAGACLDEVEGGDYPGMSVALDQLEDPPVADRPLGKPDRCPRRGQYKMQAQGDAPHIDREESAEHAAPADAPLLLADATLPAARVLDVAARLAAVRLGVAGRLSAAAHAVPLVRQGADAPALRVRLTDLGFVVGSPGAPPRELPRAGNAYDVAALTAWLGEAHRQAPDAPLALSVDGAQATAQDLAAVLDAAGGGGVTLAIAERAGSGDRDATPGAGKRVPTVTPSGD